MAAFAAQPAEKDAHQHGGVEPIRLGALVLARDRDAGRMDDVGLDPVPGQPPRQPEPVPPCLEGDGDARDAATAPLASSRQRCNRRSSAVSSGVIFFNGCRSIPGTAPAISLHIPRR